MMRKITFFALGLSLMSGTALADEAWAKGVTRASGWYDFNKGEDYFRDMGYCWAATASNILAWWQDQYAVPAGTPTGEAVWQTFRTAYTSDYGSLPKYAIEWWLTGNYAKAGEHGWAQLMPGEGIPQGGYYREYFSGDRKLGDYLTESSNQNYTAMSNNLVSALNSGSGLALSLRKVGVSGWGHEITLWGVEYDASGIKKLFVTDSDDAREGKNLEGIFEVACDGLVYAGQTLMGLQSDYYGKDIYVANFDRLAPADFLVPAVVPEPSMFGFFAGTLALLLAGTRRRRK
ncbi:MAG: IdeS/Mac family cysteine endopeptidase [Opitutales bacterium]|nr:IdeS/Mac family cysteine endopeptidase [Opitutales bacterium]